jgi:hypothetical protein
MAAGDALGERAACERAGTGIIDADLPQAIVALINLV